MIESNKEFALSIDLEYIKSLVSLATENGLTELKVESKDDKIVIKKEKEIHVAATQSVTPFTAAQTVMPVAGAEELEAKEPVTGETEKPAGPAKKGIPVVSPMVGTYYKSPAPGSPSFVEVGSEVEVGQVLCIIESMKLMNEIESEVAGTVTEICIENAEPVEAGTVLMYIE